MLIWVQGQSTYTSNGDQAQQNRLKGWQEPPLQSLPGEKTLFGQRGRHGVKGRSVTETWQALEVARYPWG